ncbi:U-scoloptoxin(01)-Cw1a-like [Penaeus indicus]|uniref:U-scoloptoxin(01)-Cw1a-like n=1 Tax=Penaeus indicus TaxID=29960 RepID=UPI00300D5FFE
MMTRFVSVSVLAAVAFVLAGGQEVLPFPETVPETSFSCVDRPYGYYADIEANCQVFHICLNNNIWSFLCPNQTLFNQEYFVCDHATNVDCSLAESLYNLNDNFGKVESQVEVEEGTEAPAE